MVVLLLAGSAVLFGLPRSVAPHDLPSPTIDQKALSATMSGDDALAAAAETTELDVDVRAVGREFRNYNSAAFGADMDAFATARVKLAAATRRALLISEEQLLRLRAYQTRQFIVELRDWERSGIVSEELRQLGGDFVHAIQRSRWCHDETRQLYADERVLRTLYKKRWNDVTAIGSEAFRATLDEDRVRYDFLLRHPLLPKSALPPTPDSRNKQITKLRLALVGRLAARDPDYAADLARGVVLFRAGQFPLSVQAFQAHLEAFPDGPNTLRARNYLRAAVERSE